MGQRTPSIRTTLWLWQMFWTFLTLQNQRYIRTLSVKINVICILCETGKIIRQRHVFLTVSKARTNWCLYFPTMYAYCTCIGFFLFFFFYIYPSRSLKVYNRQLSNRGWHYTTIPRLKWLYVDLWNVNTFMIPK